MNMRAKFLLHNSMEVADQPGRYLTFIAVTNDSHEDQTFNKYTPSGDLKMYVDNPPVLAQLQVGKKYYLDFTEAPK